MTDKNTIMVWDKFVRIFHWSLVIGFFIAYITEDEVMLLHIWAGYLALALVIIRIVWGFIGSTYARFSNFVYRPSVIIDYLKALTIRKARRYIGHNPAGGAMIILLLFSIIMISLSGIMLDQIESSTALWQNLSHSWLLDAHETEEIMEEIHEFFANFTLLMVFLHIAGVVFESRLHHENLVKSMITGLKSQK